MDLDSLLGRHPTVGGDTNDVVGPLGPEACRRLACDAALTRVLVTRHPTSHGGPSTGPGDDPSNHAGGHPGHAHRSSNHAAGHGIGSGGPTYSPSGGGPSNHAHGSSNHAAGHGMGPGGPTYSPSSGGPSNHAGDGGPITGPSNHPSDGGPITGPSGHGGHSLSGDGVLAARLRAAAALLPPVLGGAPTQPLEVGRTSRVVVAAQRAALAVRDGGCVFPGCERPLAWCEAHHLRHWLHGGPTDLSNLALLCRAHHRAVHEGGWRLGRHPDGRLTATPPDRPHRRRSAAA